MEKIRQNFRWRAAPSKFSHAWWQNFHVHMQKGEHKTLTFFYFSSKSASITTAEISFSICSIDLLSETM